MRLNSWVSAASMACVSVTVAGVGHGQAQDVLPEIAVSAPVPTGTTSDDGLQRGPLNVIDNTYQSATAITGREIQRSNAASLADLLSGLPGVSS